MSPRRQKREPDDSTRPPLFTKAEWAMILSYLHLPPRSAEVLGLAIQGFYDVEIGERLQKLGQRRGTVSPHTIRNHLKPCFARLNTDRKSRLAHATFDLFRRLRGEKS